MSTQLHHSGRWLSVAMLARNDEAVLAETLANVRPWADEVAVLDAESSDRTAEIAVTWGARVIRAPWQYDYSAARNHLLARLTGHWILWLEPGERIAEEAWPELRRLVDGTADRDNAYCLMVQDPPADRSGSVEQAAMVRLIPNRPELVFEGRVGETLKPSIQRAGLKTAVAPGRILRHPRCRDVAWKSARAWHILDLAALETNVGGAPSARVLLAMGDAASDLEDRPLARQAYSEVVRLAPRGSLEMLNGYYGILASFEGETSDSQRQLAVCLEALEVFPLDAQLLSAMGTYLQAQNRPDLAIRTFRTAVDHGQIDLESWHLADIDQVAAIYLALTLQLSGGDEEARSVLEKALERSPASQRIRRQLIDLYIKQGRTEEALAAAEAMPLEPSQREPLVCAVRGACLAVKQEWTPALALLQSAYVAGCESPVCLRWLSIVLLSTGRAAAAEPVLRRWAAVEPSSAEARTYLESLFRGDRAAAAPCEAASSGAWYRIDPPGTTVHAAFSQLPIISQFTSNQTIAAQCF